MRVIGITGSIACGKSTVSREIIRHGYPVIDGDQISRELTCPGGAALPDIRSAFGEAYLNADGSLNRRKMGRLVFSDPRAREKLDHLMAPHLMEVTRDRIREAQASGAQLCFLDMPLLFEKGYDRLCDTVWCVWLPEDLQLNRLMQRDGFSAEEAKERIRAVMSSDEKAALSATVIDNSGTVGETLSRVNDLLARELERVSAVPRRRRSVSVPASGNIPQIRHASVPQDPPESQPPEEGILRSESARRKPSSRRVSLDLPRWLTGSLIAFGLLLACVITARILMQAYLVRQLDLHRQEQNAIDEQYPLMYTAEITSAAEEYNLSPALIAAIVRNESSFRPRAESGVGARGLMQLMPKTAEWIAEKLRIQDFSFEQMYEPAKNIQFGCWYLNYLSTLFNGDPLCVVCAYHAGQGEISSWLSNPLISSDGTTMALEKLPEGPTKLYAGRVTRDYGIYQAKYFTRTLSDDAGSAAAE